MSIVHDLSTYKKTQTRVQILEEVIRSLRKTIIDLTLRMQQIQEFSYQTNQKLSQISMSRIKEKQHKIPVYEITDINKKQIKLENTSIQFTPQQTVQHNIQSQKHKKQPEQQTCKQQTFKQQTCKQQTCKQQEIIEQNTPDADKCDNDQQTPSDENKQKPIQPVNQTPTPKDLNNNDIHLAQLSDDINQKLRKVEQRLLKLQQKQINNYKDRIENNHIDQKLQVMPSQKLNQIILNQKKFAKDNHEQKIFYKQQSDRVKPSKQLTFQQQMSLIEANHIIEDNKELQIIFNRIIFQQIFKNLGISLNFKDFQKKLPLSIKLKNIIRNSSLRSIIQKSEDIYSSINYKQKKHLQSQYDIKIDESIYKQKQKKIVLKSIKIDFVQLLQLCLIFQQLVWIKLQNVQITFQQPLQNISQPKNWESGLKILQINQCQLSNKQFRMIMSYLHLFRKLQVLIISKNQISIMTDNDIKQLEKLYKLKYLKLNIDKFNQNSKNNLKIFQQRNKRVKIQIQNQNKGVINMITSFFK